MAPFEPGLTFTPSPQAIEAVRERLQRAGFQITEAGARSLVESVLAIEGPRMQAIARGILHGSLETIRQTAEVALSALTEKRSDRPGLVGVLKEQSRAAEPVEHPDEDDTRPVFKRPRGR
ncbi:MAG: hypothetical protein ACREMZ_12170 [Gemmatimonadales bacterium]